MSQCVSHALLLAETVGSNHGPDQDHDLVVGVSVMEYPGGFQISYSGGAEHFNPARTETYSGEDVIAMFGIGGGAMTLNLLNSSLEHFGLSLPVLAGVLLIPRMMIMMMIHGMKVLMNHEKYL